MALESYCKNLEARIDVLESRVADLICHDPGTGLPNRRNLMERLEEIVAQAYRYGLSRSLLLIRVIGLEAVPVAGDRTSVGKLMRALSAALKVILRDTDFLAVSQDGEFVVILGDLGKGSPLTTRQRILSEIDIADIATGELPIDDLDLRIGIAIYPNDGDTAEDLIRHARDDAAGTV